jgi:hypothetical protein
LTSESDNSLYFDGRKSDARIAAAVRGEITWRGESVKPYRKKTLTYAVRMDEPFEVNTLEGKHTGKAGDYLAIGAHGEMYPIDAAVFEATYEPA